MMRILPGVVCGFFLVFAFATHHPSGLSTPAADAGHEHCWHSANFQHAIPNHDDQTCCKCGENRCHSTEDGMVAYCAQHGPKAPGCEFYNTPPFDAGEVVTLVDSTVDGGSIAFSLNQNQLISLNANDLGVAATSYPNAWSQELVIYCGAKTRRTYSMNCDGGVLTVYEK